MSGPAALHMCKELVSARLTYRTDDVEAQLLHQNAFNGMGACSTCSETLRREGPQGHQAS